ncbi:hypothetical protein PGT21_009925 [Puccinia graminis f. sp. tritici]|uniref:Uncharacterized protein n=1 Tax=Puccinia graminis f. sp. tritici TaxID=56615 RepID=A0A5B0S3M0_PUCGR|nr:hypothetical protein PGT21_009925 [Puccinia graminis f. sp. tritici]KAA1132358.1 hypothetical protein PGTUg99_008988 [Puccinia graminis f. sp. tritici]
MIYGEDPPGAGQYGATLRALIREATVSDSARRFFGHKFATADQHPQYSSRFFKNPGYGTIF